ncbi:antigen peptide transporter 2 [Myripristis murdjan]|uniref:Transporter associated with antigen processing, subunit type t, teleost specific n=1 Tax=Myripristis murdjan TaxID=586833 RepID=A0A668AS12_9TELE|nr:antigen peptide transporter 2-like [Myripristis murdjan]
MRGVTAGVFALLLSDLLLWLALWAGLVLLECSSGGGLAALWALGAVKWPLLYSVTRLVADGEPQCVLHRFVALLCLLPAVFHSGRMLLEPDASLLPEPGMVLLALISSTLACVLWEIFLPSDGGMRKVDKKLSARAVLIRVLKYFRPDILYVIAAFAFLILGVICDTFIPYYQGKVVDMLSGQTLESGFFFAIGQLALVSLGSAVFSCLRGSTFMWTLSRLNKTMKLLLFHNLLQQDVHFFKENSPGSLASRLDSDVDKMGRTVALNSNVLVRSTVKTSLMLILMLRLSWKLTVLTCVEIPLLFFMQKTYITFSTELKNQIQDCQAQNKKLASQIIEGIRTVRSFKAEEDEMKRYNVALEHMGSVKRRTGIYSSVYCLLRRLVSVGIKVLMLLVGRSLVSSGQLSIGSLLTFFLYQKPMSNNVKEISYGLGEMVSTVGVISKVFNYLDRKPKCKEAGDLAPEKLEGRITFSDVTFAYPSTPDKPALKSVSVELQPGKVTALVGPSGSGKTSCVSLLKRLYEPQEGQILLDGQPLHCYKHKYLHQKMALVSQNPVLFSGSVRYNIEYGLKDCDPEKVTESARKAKAEGLISKLDNEYDTDVGEGGRKLAVGLRQCIAIARALVREPQIIILDEGTSSLDVDVQYGVVQELLTCGKTVLMVTHQLKTVEKADHIIFMENGTVVEQGTHHDLMARKGRYHRLKQELFT